jgi:hypothetical protein
VAEDHIYSMMRGIATPTVIVVETAAPPVN